MLELGRFPRVRLGHLPTPLEPMARLSAHLGGPKRWIKRGDKDAHIVFIHAGGQVGLFACEPAFAA